MNLPQHPVEIVNVLHHLIVDHQIERRIGKREEAVADLVNRPAPWPRVRSRVEDIRTGNTEPGSEARIHQCARAASKIEDRGARLPLRELAGEIQHKPVGHVHKSSLYRRSHWFATTCKSNRAAASARAARDISSRGPRASLDIAAA